MESYQIHCNIYKDVQVAPIAPVVSILLRVYSRRSHSWYQILNSESQSLLAERAEGRGGGGGGSDDGVEDNTVASADSSINFSPDLL